MNDKGENEAEEDPVNVVHDTPNHEDDFGGSREAQVQPPIQSREVELRQPRAIKPQARNSRDMRRHKRRDEPTHARGLSHEKFDTRTRGTFPLHTRPSPRHWDVAI